MMRKTPESIKKLIEAHQTRQDWLQEQIDLRQNPNIPPESITYMPERGIEYFEAMAVGQNQLLEDALHFSKCYHGFNHVGKWRQVPYDNDCSLTFKHRDMGGNVKPEEYKDWRRQYFIR